MAWSYLPHTDNDRQEMLSAIGIQSREELFSHVPAKLRFSGQLKLPDKMSELELVKHLRELSEQNADLADYTCFLGAGAYDHFIPSVVDHVLSRSEFYTAYTQYQPELSQGYLQVLWEFQSMICELTGMQVANASLYDGGTALAEAAMMACGVTGRKQVIIGNAVHPFYQRVLKTYGQDWGYEVVNEGRYKEAAAVIIQNPNFFGCIEDFNSLADLVHKEGALLIVCVDPISLGMIKPPGEYGADIVVGEGQSLGLPLSFGGPYLGFFAATQKLMRKMPGRIVGQTTDINGKRGFVLTLQAREQHIRRDKATSNICSNEALCALASAVYLSTVGKEGLKKVAELCLNKAYYAFEKLTALSGCEAVFAVPFFKEFVIRFNRPVSEVNKKLLEHRIIGGLDLEKYDAEYKNCMLICITEKRTRTEIDRLIDRLGAIL